MNSLPIPPVDPDFAYKIEYVGAEQEPVIIIDNVVVAPELLVDWASVYAKFEKADAFYPGLRAKAPARYSQFIQLRLGPLITKIFGMEVNKPIRAECKFSMVSTPATDLLAGQSIPHFDSLNRLELAGVHYLCSPDKGGTSLYRHKATGFESVNDERISQFRKSAYVEAESIKGSFMNGDNDFYERIASYDAAFNRMIIYRCSNLHSGNISKSFTPDVNPRSGRLTITSFMYQ